MNNEWIQIDNVFTRKENILDFIVSIAFDEVYRKGSDKEHTIPGTLTEKIINRATPERLGRIENVRIKVYVSLSSVEGDEGGTNSCGVNLYGPDAMAFLTKMGVGTEYAKTEYLRIYGLFRDATSGDLESE